MPLSMRLLERQLGGDKDQAFRRRTPPLQTQDHRLPWGDRAGFTQKTLWPVRNRLVDLDVEYLYKIGPWGDFKVDASARTYLALHVPNRPSRLRILDRNVCDREIAGPVFYPQSSTRWIVDPIGRCLVTRHPCGPGNRTSRQQDNQPPKDQ